MNKLNEAYIAIDLHRKNSVIGYTDQAGQLMGMQQVQTNSKNLVNELVSINADNKYLTIEQTNMAFAIAEQLADYVDKLIVCDPRHNKLISQSANKNDRQDVIRLCRLLRLGELKPVWRPKKMGKRRLYYSQVKRYYRLVKALTRSKNRLQASLRHWGVNMKLSKSDYHHPSAIIEDMDREGLQKELADRFAHIEQLNRQKDRQLARIKASGADFWEVSEFQQMTGIGPVGAHTLSAYLQTPYRFGGRKQLIRFCQLAVAKRSSDGRQYGREHLDKAGHSRLKQVSYIAWETAQKSDNEVNRFYQASLKRSTRATNARLNTQRKILVTLWSLWKHKRTYRPDKFCAGRGNSTQ